jgi:hypothetical protein
MLTLPLARDEQAAQGFLRTVSPGAWKAFS